MKKIIIPLKKYFKSIIFSYNIIRRFVKIGGDVKKLIYYATIRKDGYILPVNIVISFDKDNDLVISFVERSRDQSLGDIVIEYDVDNSEVETYGRNIDSDGKTFGKRIKVRKIKER